MVGPIQPACQKCTSEPQMPVLLIAIVTSPGLSDCPLVASSTEGCAGAIHRSCAGLVYTPMFGLLTLISVVVGAMVVVVVVVDMFEVREVENLRK